jgi:uncharacterized protein (DUF305 family)
MMSVAAEPEVSAVGAPVEPAAPGRRPWIYVGLALAVVLGLLIGYAGGLLTPALARPGEDSAEAGFARDMSSHHAQAVEMAMIAHEKAATADVRTLGADIALTQQAQIGMMQTWLRDWGLEPTGSRPRMAWMPDGQRSLEHGLMPGMATDAELARLRAATGKDVDVLFLQLMIKHHLGGIHMAEGVLAQSDDAEVRRLAQTMVNGQRGEIAAMQALLQQLTTPA